MCFFQALFFKPLTFETFKISFNIVNTLMAPPFKPSFWSLLPLSNYFKCGTFIQAHYFNVISSLKHRSRSFFQAHDVFQDLSFKPKTFVKLPPSSPKTYLKIILSSPKPISSPFFQVLSCSSFAFTSSFTHAQKMRGANSKLTSKSVHF